MTEFNFTFNGPENQPQTYSVASGNIMFVLGANGTGKSTLMQLFATQHQGKVRRLTAHRQVWFHSDTIDLTPQGRQQTESQITSSDIQRHSRWRDDHASQRSQAVIFDLIDAENVEAREIADAVRTGDMEHVQYLASLKSPITKMNDILRVANLHFQIEVHEGSKLTAIRNNHTPYSIAELSDGERNALITAANVLTAKNDTLFLIDEPERHLHRAVVSPLITTLLAHRPDCAFVISTHDVALPLDQFECSALLVRRYSHDPQNWVTDYVAKVEDLDEQTAEAVLGARQLLLFVEGSNSSLDLQLYQILFPELSIRAVGTCVEVERAVKGLRAAGNCHWLSAIGLVDRDNRTMEDCDALAADGLIALDQYSVESLYYHPRIIREVANTVSDESDELVIKATQQIIEAVTQNADRLAARISERRIRNEVLRQTPDWREIVAGNTDVQFDGSPLYEEERRRLDELIRKCDVAGLVSRYPIRETPATTSVARATNFISSQAYEQKVRKLLIDSSDARSCMRDLLRPLSELIASQTVDTEQSK